MVPTVTNRNPRSSEVLLGRTLVQVDAYPVANASTRAIVVHGPWEHAALLSPIALALQAAGHDVVAPEFPGCGRTVNKSTPEFSTWVGALVALAHKVRDERSATIAIVGVGLGGIIAFHAAAAGAPVDLLFATNLADPRTRTTRERILGSGLRAAVVPIGLHWLGMAKPERRWLPPLLSFRHATDDAQVQVALDADPGFTPSHCMRFLGSWFTTAPAVEPEAFTATRVVLAAPTADRIFELAPSLDTYRVLPGDKQLHMLHGAGHLPVDEPSVQVLTDAFRASLS